MKTDTSSNMGRGSPLSLMGGLNNRVSLVPPLYGRHQRLDEHGRWVQKVAKKGGNVTDFSKFSFAPSAILTTCFSLTDFKIPGQWPSNRTSSTSHRSRQPAQQGSCANDWHVLRSQSRAIQLVMRSETRPSRSHFKFGMCALHHCANC